MNKKSKKKFYNSPLLAPVLIFTYSLLRGQSFGLSVLVTITVSIFIILSISISIFLHELGHFIAGKIVGYKLASFRIKKTSYDLSNGKVKKSKKESVGYEGLCSMIPTSDSPSKYAFFISGGPIINLLIGIPVLLLVSPVDFITIFVVAFGVASLTLGITNIIPIKTKKNLDSDGMQLKNILFKKGDYKLLYSIIKSDSQTYHGIRPKEMQIEINQEDEFNINYAILVAIKAIDEWDIDTLLYCCDNFERLSESIASYSAETINGIICYASCITNNTDKAKKYYTKIEKMVQNDETCNSYRIRAYYEFYINENIECAKSLCIKGLNAIDKYIYSGYAIMENELLIKLQNQTNDILNYS